MRSKRNCICSDVKPADQLSKSAISSALVQDAQYQYLVYHPSALITAATRRGIDLVSESNRDEGTSFHASCKYSAIHFLTAAGPPGHEARSGNFS